MPRHACIRQLYVGGKTVCQGPDFVMSATLPCCRKDLLTSMVPKYRELLKYKLSILVFSGDVDGVVPVSFCTSLRSLSSCTAGRTC